MALQTLMVLQDLPKFAGNPKQGDVPFKSEIDARTFLRSVENYFLQNQITTDEKKLQVLFSLIDKKRGDAIRLITCYAGKNVPFEEVKAEFLSMYPSFKVTEFKHAAQTLLDTNLSAQNMFCGMTSLEIASRAAAEAYLNYEPLTKGKFGHNTKLSNATAVGTSAIPPPPPPPSSTTDDITLLNVLQNYTMHLFVATQVSNKVYEKVSSLGPTTSSTRFMAETVKTFEKYKLLSASKTKRPEKNAEVIWRANKQQPTSTTTAKYERPEVKCYNCDKMGHMKKDCKTCSYCKKYGHIARECKKRLAEAKGKFCNNCKMHDSHSTKDCRKKPRAKEGFKNTVNVAQEDESIPHQYEYNWCPTIEERDTKERAIWGSNNQEESNESSESDSIEEDNY